MKEIKIKNKMAFTLAETLIALVILGIIAAVTIPTLIRNHVDNANRAKVKKAMSMYEKALNNMIIENDLRSTDAIKTFGGLPENAEANTNNCASTIQYFKTVEGGNCRFKTADGDMDFYCNGIYSDGTIFEGHGCEGNTPESCSNIYIFDSNGENLIAKGDDCDQSDSTSLNDCGYKYTCHGSIDNCDDNE